MSPAELDKILDEAPDAIRELLGDLSPKIVEAAKATLEESQDTEAAKATVKVGISLSIDLTCSPVAWQVEASVGVRHKVKGESHVADVSPELLEGMGKGSKRKVTMSINGDPEIDATAALDRVERRGK